MPDYRRLFASQKSRAQKRGVGWELTYEEWLKIWENSGHLNERGSYLGCYVMARYGDKGPYKVGNVRIVTTSENLREAGSIRHVMNGYGRAPVQTRPNWSDDRLDMMDPLAILEAAEEPVDTAASLW